MVQSIERPTQTTGGVFTCYPIGANAHNPTVRDVNEHEGLTYSKPVLKCRVEVGSNRPVVTAIGSGFGHLVANGAASIATGGEYGKK